MDAANGALLNTIIEAHENWRRAEAVLDGRQPAIDPDRSSLVEFDGDVRVYSPYERRELVDGKPMLTKYHVSKRLVDGMWRRTEVADDVRLLA